MVFDFETFRADFDRRQVFRSGEEVHLSPKALQLLEILIETRPRALSKAEIQDRLWPSTFVAESNLATIVNEVRRAIGDDARTPRYIRTVHGFGYAFDAEPLQTVAAPPRRGDPVAKLVGRMGELPLYRGRNVIGRDPDVEVQVDDKTVSRHHAAVTLAGDEASIEDLESKNGTFIDDVRVQSAVPLRDGAIIDVGSVRLVFRAEFATSSTTTLYR